MTYKALARKSGLHTQTIVYRILNEDLMTTAEKGKRIAMALNVPVEKVMPGIQDV